MERPTGYLFRPDPDDPYFRQSPGKFRAELLDRLTAPLYCFIFALVPLLFLGQATSTRQTRTPSIAAAVLLTIAIRSIPIFLNAETSMAAVVMMWVVPIALSVIIAAMVLGGIQLRPPERLVALGEGVRWIRTGISPGSWVKYDHQPSSAARASSVLRTSIASTG